MKSENIKEIILAEFIDSTLSNDRKPESIYKLCKKLKIDDSEFYNHFGSIESVDLYFWEFILSQTMKIIEPDLEATDNPHHRLLTFYFTLFENLKLNRSYILFNTSSANNRLQVDMKLRKTFSPKLYEMARLFKNPLSAISEEFSERISKEGLWLQFISLFHFWLKDNSKGFEKTDAFIEKSVRLGEDLTENLPLEGVFDFGKFVFKEFKKIV